jgi:hypothetical protein
MLLWTLVVEQAHGVPVTVEHVGAVTIAVAGVDAVAISLILPSSPRENVYASNQFACELEELTLTLGEGPGVDGLDGGLSLAADLGDPWCQTRWPIFAPAAIDRGARAAFALPLQVGGIRLGVMDLYRSRPGTLEADQLADALLLADTACALLLDTARAGDGRRPEMVGLQHPQVHQATGMIIAQIGASAAIALIRLRAYAYAHDLALRDVAADVVSRRLRFHPDAPRSDPADREGE